MPESVRDRLSTTYEFVFLLTTGPRYYFNLDAVRVPHGDSRPARGAGTRGSGIGGRNAKYTQPAAFAGLPRGPAMRPGRRHDIRHPRGKNPGDVWRLSTRPSREAHFAAFPIDIPLRCIAAGCPPHGVVLDPFSGSGTTGLAALQLGRRYLGIDLNADFTAIAQRRLNAVALLQSQGGSHAA